MSCTDAGKVLTPEDAERLLAIAQGAVRHAVAGEGLSLGALPAALTAHGACFVSLHHHGRLRGCIGSLEAHQSLVDDALHNAAAAALRDPRFPPVSKKELPGLEVSVSVLSAAVPMNISSEEELIERLRPGVDGVILEYGSHRATFLPVVWEQLPHAREFLQHLKEKAGLPKHFWHPLIRISCYQAQAIGP